MDLISKKHWFFGFSAVVVAASIIAIAVFGLRQGIDLKGGSQWQVAFMDSAPTEQALVEVLHVAVPAHEATVKRASGGDFLIRLPSITPTEYATYQTVLRGIGEYQERSFSNIGPVIGSELRTKALWAIVLVLLGISLYVAFAFRKVSEPVRSWKYGVVTLLTLFHDVIIPTGMLAILGNWKGIEIDTNFIVALLVVMGFSVHDTIVVFDRIREHLLKEKGKRVDLAVIVNQSVQETYVRSFNTSLTLILVLVALLIFGPTSLFYFVLTMLVGTMFGTYSSIFVASPLLYLWGRKAQVK
ncbi:MAG: protein translocase subunit SecF [bacterium]|nr:protein translocase subunit SecF [bacterium]